MTQRLLLLAGLAAGGCAESGNNQPSAQQRQDAALKDPFGYGPSVPTQGGKPAPQPAAPERDDSAGGDWKRFWNP